MALFAAVAAVLFPATAHAARQTADQPDDLPGYAQVHVMYVLPSDGADRAYDTDGTIAGSVASWQNWLMAETGGRGLNLDTAGGALDITFARLDSKDAQLNAFGLNIRDELERQLKARGFDDPNKILAVYYDGSAQNVCGGAAWPPNLPGTVAASYLRGTFSDPGTPSCDSNPWAAPNGPAGYREFSNLHEIFHTMGFVAQCAPHHTRAGHVSDNTSDLMYAGDSPWTPSILDYGRDDYFRTSPDPACPDLSTSYYLQGNGKPPAAGPAPTPSPEPTPAPGPSPTPAPPVASACVVPRVTGLKRAAAVKRVRAAQCGTARVTTRRARTRRERKRIGRVAVQKPRAGARLAAGARVRLVVLRRR